MKSFDLLPDDIQQKIKSIKSDNTSGSLDLTKKAAETFIELIENLEKNKKISKRPIKSTGYHLVNAQPAMASIFNLSNRILLLLDDLTEEKIIAEEVKKHCKQFIKQLNLTQQKISKNVLNLIKNHSTIATISYSNTVFNAIKYAKKSGKKFTVICPESRPMKEGVTLAKKLGEQNIKVKLVVDSGIFSLLKEIDTIFVGSDSITEKGLVNKVGTLGLAMAAKESQIHFYALSGTRKILPKNCRVPFREQKNSAEVLSKSFKNVKPVNYYFELTPFKYITSVVTEEGVKKTREINRYIDSLRVHRLFS